MKFTNIIEKFVNKMGYLENKDVEGIIFYGSNQTGFANKFSDIDLHIIFNNNIKEEIRGSSFIDGYRIEYFEKSLRSMYDKTINEYKQRGNAVVSMIVYGNTIFDRNGEINKLKNFITEVYSKPLPKLDIEETKEQIAIISNFIDDLKNLIENNDIYANHIFHLTLERIKDLYFSYNGLPGVSRTKALKVMLNDDYRKAIKKENPDEYFIKLYLRCLDESSTVKNRFIDLLNLLKFTIKDINFDKNNHRIVLCKKNEDLI